MCIIYNYGKCIHDDLRAILNYLDLDRSGNRSYTIQRIRENCKGKEVTPRLGVIGQMQFMKT